MKESSIVYSSVNGFINFSRDCIYKSKQEVLLNCINTPNVPNITKVAIKALPYIAIAAFLVNPDKFIEKSLNFYEQIKETSSSIRRFICPVLEEAPNFSLYSMPLQLCQSSNFPLEITKNIFSFLSIEEQVLAKTVCKYWRSTWYSIKKDHIYTMHARPQRLYIQEAPVKYTLIQRKVIISYLSQIAQNGLRLFFVFGATYLLSKKINQIYNFRIDKICSFSQKMLKKKLKKFNLSAYCEYHNSDKYCRARLPSEMLATTQELVRYLQEEAKSNRIFSLFIVNSHGGVILIGYLNKIIKILKNRDITFNRDKVIHELNHKFTFLNSLK